MVVLGFDFISLRLPRHWGMVVLGFELYGKGTRPKNCQEGIPYAQRDVAGVWWFSAAWDTKGQTYEILVTV